jgi:uncharacterized membrane protein (DUF485 family)
MDQPSRPKPPPPPPGKRGSAVQSHSSETQDTVAVPSRPSPPPPPVSKRASLESSSSAGEETSPMRQAPSVPPVPKKPPKHSEIKTIPVEKALQSVLDQHSGNLEDPILSDRSDSPVRPGDEHQHFNKSPSYSSNPFAGDDSTHNNMTTDTENPAFPRSSHQVVETVQSLVKSPNKGQPENLIYHKTTFSELWFCIFLLVHIIQFILLISAAKEQLPAGAMVVIVLLVVAVIVLVILSRFYVKKSRLSSSRNLRLKRGIRTPDDEADEVDDRAVYLLCTACILEGISFAIFAAVVAGRSSHLNDGGFYTQDTILQILRFASITLLCLHRIIRPANRIDPMRTVLEVSCTFRLLVSSHSLLISFIVGSGCCMLGCY